MSYLAIDQGTTSTRAYILGRDGQGRVVHTAEHRQFLPAPGHVEHDANELLDHVRAAIKAGRDIAPISAIGIANQGETCLGWNAATGAPIGRAIVWQDDRTSNITKALAPKAEVVMELAGLPLDPYFSASKLGLIAALPEAIALRKQGLLRLGTTDAFFRDRLCARFETDPATASRTSLMALATCRWDERLCDLFGVPMECLPSIRPTTGDLGEIDGLPLTASLVDQQAALFGHGARRAGAAKITFGTGAFALVLAGDSPPATGQGILPTIGWHMAGQPQRYALEGGVYAASSAVNWARDLGLFANYDELNSYKEASAISRGLAFVPALAGLACPHWDRGARGAWLGLSLDTTRRDMMQALLEGIAFRAAEVIAAMGRQQPIHGAISIDGGMTANGYFCQFLADILQREISVSTDPELTARGAASLAAIGLGEAEPPGPKGHLIKPRPGADLTDTFSAAREAVQGFSARISR